MKRFLAFATAFLALAVFADAQTKLPTSIDGVSILVNYEKNLLGNPLLEDAQLLPGQNDFEDHPERMIQVCRIIITNDLTVPLSAKFYNESLLIYGAKTWYMNGIVLSTNKLGVPLASKFFCIAHQNGTQVSVNWGFPKN